MDLEGHSLNILMSSTSYPETSRDWRGRFIANQAAALARRGDVSLSLWAPPGELPDGVSAATTSADALWLGRLSQRGGIAHLLRTRKVLAAGAIVGLLGRLGRAYRRLPVDVVHVNWLQNALPLWGSKTPALITVLGSDFGLLRLPGMKAMLRTVLRQRRAILAPNADWMRPGLERTFGDLAEIRPIAFGVDDPWFEVVRHPPANNPKQWLAVTRLTHNKIGDLFTWGEGLFNDARQLHLFGPMQETLELPSWVRYHGATHPADLLENWFPQACGLITLSRHDEGRPQVMLEAMAAGIPVLASSLPAHRDMVRHRETGWLAASRDELCQGLDWLEDPLQNQSAGQAARSWIKQSIGTWDDCATRYAAAYQDLLERKT
ncbi:Glycosyltransferase involved in cell wall bisynthesis [Polaromonas sp. YR568]|uniref:glycosyltransferase family 4 protein n=1 Tax=Polaromonas sp. YR568 TaxID=1855301 RepID=UPI0008EF9E05|nr:glycosyltransferase family 4 protein [Polaromonas sp. YR568]SFV01883.1 Glycosyltransferase involved in cell wall bisynthesis [Polaromonas sp. YR568]